MAFDRLSDPNRPGRRALIRGAGAALAGMGAWPLLPAAPASAAVPTEHLAVLRRGINVTNWFRFPADASPERLRAYLPDAVMAELRAVGFTFVRLCIQPQVLLREGGRLDPVLLGVVLDSVRRLQRAGLGVIVDAHPETWRFERNPSHRQGLLDFWRQMAPALRSFDPRITFPEVMNEPVEDHAFWARLQDEALAIIRKSLPESTVILTGADWGSLNGLTRLKPVRDRRIIYSFHDYDPKMVTTLAFWETDPDKAMLARLPFPVRDAASCNAVATETTHARSRAIAEAYCAERWDAGRIEATMARAAAWGRQHGVPVAALEFGAHAQLNEEARIAYFIAFREAADRHGIPWALWGYGDIMGFPMRRGTGRAPLTPAVLHALGLQDTRR
jgi:aryl-phospho-beta-D-glucosidase BglC (GH1 family)